jgi:CheY-like chemotaxis protein
MNATQIEDGASPGGAAGESVFITAQPRMEPDLFGQNREPATFHRVLETQRIAPELMDKIADPFVPIKPLGQGAGPGLPTLLGIAEKHGGFVLQESLPGKDSAFRVYLPGVLDDQVAAVAGSGQTALSRGNGELVLLVDDEPAIRHLASAILTRNGYRVVVATHGNEGLAVFEQQQHEIRLVVSDLMMPQLDGPGMIRSLRTTQSDLKSIIITGLGEEHRIAEARAVGAVAVLIKPFTAEQLLAAIKQALD